jgi:hypothetical protein
MVIRGWRRPVEEFAGKNGDFTVTIEAVIE